MPFPLCYPSIFSAQCYLVLYLPYLLYFQTDHAIVGNPTLLNPLIPRQVSQLYRYGGQSRLGTLDRMATNNHHQARPSLSMSYSQGSIGSGNGMSFSQSQLGSFNASQSVASTPRATPPPKSSQQSAMSFNYPNGIPNGTRASFNGFEDMNGYGTIMYHEEFKPQIYRVCSSLRSFTVFFRFNVLTSM